MKTRHYLFIDKETEEYFIVGAFDVKEAWSIARDYFVDPCIYHEMSEFEAENSGLDEY